MSAEKFLRAVQPYLVVKSKEAEIALEFRATYGKSVCSNTMPAVRRLPEEVVEARVALRQKLMSSRHGR